jgi:hypothetical protein
MAVFGLAAMPFLYAVFRNARPGAALALTVASLGAATAAGALAPPYSPEHPRGTSLVYTQTPDGKAHWVLMGSGPLDRDYVAKHGFAPGDGGLGGTGLARGPMAAKALSSLNLPAPIWRETGRRDEGDTTIVLGTLQASRDGLFVAVVAPEGSGVYSIAFAGGKAAERPSQEAKPIFVRALGLRRSPMGVEIRMTKGRAADVLFAEQSALPDTDEARSLSAARGSLTMPVHLGDGAVVIVRHELAVQLADASHD